MTFFPSCLLAALPVKFSPNVIMKNKSSRSAPLEGGTSVYPQQGFSPTRCEAGEEAEECRINKTNFKGRAFFNFESLREDSGAFQIKTPTPPPPLNVAPIEWL